jgi:hypothetical protein
LPVNRLTDPRFKSLKDKTVLCQEKDIRNSKSIQQIGHFQKVWFPAGVIHFWTVKIQLADFWKMQSGCIRKAGGFCKMTTGAIRRTAFPDYA